MMKNNIPYQLYKIYAEFASHYYAFKELIKPIPPQMVIQICSKPGHVEKLCPKEAKDGIS